MAMMSVIRVIQLRHGRQGTRVSSRQLFGTRKGLLQRVRNAKLLFKVLSIPLDLTAISLGTKT